MSVWTEKAKQARVSYSKKLELYYGVLKAQRRLCLKMRESIVEQSGVDLQFVPLTSAELDQFEKDGHARTDTIADLVNFAEFLNLADVLPKDQRGTLEEDLEDEDVIDDADVEEVPVGTNQKATTCNWCDEPKTFSSKNAYAMLFEFWCFVMYHFLDGFYSDVL